MFANIPSVNTLTALLVAHQVRYAVLCPGSRNAPIVHNLCLCESITCYPVTDERSAGFFALGIALAKKTQVAVCVTSGSALLNLAPAVAEAYYQHLPLIVISADRPEAWIDQLDGQTMRQPGALACCVNKFVSLPSVINGDTGRWHCNRLVNEALLATKFPFDGPVHINVPIAEPLFDFSAKDLPAERVICRRIARGGECAERVVDLWMSAKRPMIIIGQFAGRDDTACEREYLQSAVNLLSHRGVCLAEKLCWLTPFIQNVDEAVAAVAADDRYWPDLIVYGGGTVVSKRMKAFLRRCIEAKTVMVSPDGEIRDVTMHADEVVQLRDLYDLMKTLAHRVQAGDCTEDESTVAETVKSQIEYYQLWQNLLDWVSKTRDEYEPPYSQMAAVRYLEQQLEDMDYGYAVHYANSSAVRLANIYADHPVYCNRGVNGIEGTLSTAAGFSAATDDMVLCVIGDLSFFYDQNALWNKNLRGNLRILLLNNAEGGIFRQLNGLTESQALRPFVNGAHHTSAQGICEQSDIGYMKAHNISEMQVGIVRLLTEQTNRPILLEVFTDPDTDTSALVNYYAHFRNHK